GAVTLARVPAKQIDADEFLVFTWRDRDGNVLGRNDYMPRAYKEYDVPQANVTTSWSADDGKPVLVLSTDKPALFVTATTDLPGSFPDHAFTLLPGEEKRLGFTPRKGAKVSQKALAQGLKVRHLRQTF